MSKYNDLELALIHELESCRAELRRAVKTMSPREAAVKDEFISRELVQAKDHKDDAWMLGNYIGPRYSEDYPYNVKVSGVGDLSFVYCRLPKDVPSILIRHDGNDECPVSDGKAKVLVIENQDKTLSTENIGIGLAENIFWRRIKFYMILPEYVK